jgi:FdhD protein
VAVTQAPPEERGQAAVRVRSLRAGRLYDQDETLAVEAPLEIRVAGSDPVITMRTPGNDRELAAGLLASEGLVRSSRDLELLEPCPAQEHLILAQLSASAAREVGRLRRAGIVSSACGVCGKVSGFGFPRPPRLWSGPPVALHAAGQRIRRCHNREAGGPTAAGA